MPERAPRPPIDLNKRVANARGDTRKRVVAGNLGRARAAKVRLEEAASPKSQELTLYTGQMGLQADLTFGQPRGWEEAKAVKRTGDNVADIVIIRKTEDRLDGQAPYSSEAPQLPVVI